VFLAKRLLNKKDPQDFDPEISGLAGEQNELHSLYFDRIKYATSLIEIKSNTE
jgi:hypothetical protein